MQGDLHANNLNFDIIRHYSNCKILNEIQKFIIFRTVKLSELSCSVFCIIWRVPKGSKNSSRNVKENCSNSLWTFFISLRPPSCNFFLPLRRGKEKLGNRENVCIIPLWSHFSSLIPLQVPTSVPVALPLILPFAATKKLQKETLRRVSYCTALNKLDV